MVQLHLPVRRSVLATSNGGSDQIPPVALWHCERFLFSKINIYICKKSDMAISIKSIPTLRGKNAKVFEVEAIKNANNPTHRLSEESKRRLEDFLRRSKEFSF